MRKFFFRTLESCVFVSKREAFEERRVVSASVAFATFALSSLRWLTVAQPRSRMTGEVGGLPYSDQAAFATRLEVPRAVRTWELLLVGSRFSVKGPVSFFSLNSTSYEVERTRRIKDLMDAQ